MSATECAACKGLMREKMECEMPVKAPRKGWPGKGSEAESIKDQRLENGQVVPERGHH